MRIKYVIERLQRENPEEELVFILDGDTSQYYLLDPMPFLHAGPKKFTDKRGNEYFTSVVMIKAKKQEK